MRIDAYLTKINKYESRTKAAQAINDGQVLFNGKPVKPSFDVSAEMESCISYIENKEVFVSNGGYKLSKALKDFNFSVKDKQVVDIGASNGGFTDCLLKNGASLVCAVDVGENQLHESLKNDKKVIIKDNTNARNIVKEDFSFSIDLITVDVSFISLKYLLDNISNLLDDNKHLLALIKPQFECDVKFKLKNGILKDKKQHQKIVEGIFDFASKQLLIPQSFTTAPIKQGKNIEYLMLFEKNGHSKITKEEIKTLINQ